MERRDETLMSLIKRVSNSDKNLQGGRVTRQGSNMFILDDCMAWGDFHSERVRDHFPDIHICVVSSRSSLSGFSVMFHRDQHGHMREWVWTGLLGFVLALFAWMFAQLSNAGI